MICTIPGRNCPIRVVQPVAFPSHAYPPFPLPTHARDHLEVPPSPPNRRPHNAAQKHTTRQHLPLQLFVTVSDCCPRHHVPQQRCRGTICIKLPQSRRVSLISDTSTCATTNSGCCKQRLVSASSLHARQADPGTHRVLHYIFEYVVSIVLSLRTLTLST
jgi:hypothetical protein